MAEHTYYPICDQCVRAEGDECHTPGCALFLHDTPDHQIHEEHGIDLARVRRDAAREALDGLAKAELDHVAHMGKHSYPAQIAQGIATAAWNYKWKTYGGAHPEETP